VSLATLLEQLQSSELHAEISVETASHWALHAEGMEMGSSWRAARCRALTKGATRAAMIRREKENMME